MTAASLMRALAARRLQTPPLAVPTVAVAGAMLLALAALGFILRFSVNQPVVDEWDLTHVLLGGMSLGEWSFTRLNEHLFIPANAAFFLLHAVSGLDFRVGMLANLAAHLLASLLLIGAARTIRGGPSAADLLLPAALLHWGHAYNLLMSFQLAFGLFLLAAAAMLRIIAAAAPGREGRTATHAAIALLLLMLNGGMGVAFVPVLSIWIGALAWRSGRRLPWLLLALAWAYCAIALLGAAHTAARPGDTISATRFAWCVVQYLGMGTGLWYDGPHWPRNGLLIAAGYAVLCVVLAWRCLRQTDGGRTAGLLCFLLGHAAVAAGIALSRGGGIAERYVSLSCIGVAAAYLAVLTLQPRPWLRWPALAAAALLVVANIGPGQHYGHDLRGTHRSFEADLRGGMPCGFLSDKYQDRLRVGDNLEPAIDRLRAAGVRHFALAAPTPQMAELPIAAARLDANLPGPGRRVLGLLAEIEVVERTPWSELHLHVATRSGKRTLPLWPPRAPGRYVLRFWIDDRPESIRLIEPSLPSAIRLHRLAWLVPQESNARNSE